MRLSELLNPRAVSLRLAARTKREALVELVELLESAHGFRSQGEILDRVMRREAMMTTGIGNGSTFRMIPVIFLTERAREAAGKGRAAEEQAIKDANKEAAAVLGFSGAIGAYGGFFIPKSYGTSIELMGGPEGALYLFIVFYLTCNAITWWFYSRRNAEMPC